MVKFDRSEAISYIFAHIDILELIDKRSLAITLTVTGSLYDGALFKGSDTVKIVYNLPRGVMLDTLYAFLI